MKNNLCLICEEGHLSPQTQQIEVAYRGHTDTRESRYSVCDACGSEQATAADARTNKRDMTAFKKQVDGLLIGSEVRLYRKKWGIKQDEAAKIFGGGPVAFSKYENDEVTQSEAMDKLLRVAYEVPGVFENLVANSGIMLTSDSVAVDSREGPTIVGWQSITSVGPAEKKPKKLTILHQKTFDESEQQYAYG